MLRCHPKYLYVYDACEGDTYRSLPKEQDLEKHNTGLSYATQTYRLVLEMRYAVTLHVSRSWVIIN